MVRDQLGKKRDRLFTATISLPEGNDIIYKPPELHGASCYDAHSARAQLHLDAGRFPDEPCESSAATRHPVNPSKKDFLVAPAAKIRPAGRRTEPAILVSCTKPFNV